MQIECLDIILNVLDQNSKDLWPCLFRDHEGFETMNCILHLDSVDVSSNNSVKYLNGFGISI